MGSDIGGEAFIFLDIGQAEAKQNVSLILRQKFREGHQFCLSRLQKLFRILRNTLADTIKKR